MSKLSKAIQLAEKAANLLKKKKSVSKDDVIKYSGDHGVPNAKKFLGKERVSKAGAKFTKDTTKRQKEMAKKSETSKAKRQLRTPTGTKTAPKKAPKKPASRKKTSAEARKGARNRSEEGKQSYTTRVGEGAGNSPKSKDLSKEDKKRLHKKRREARRKTEAQESGGNFESRLNQEARAGGVQSPGSKARGASKLEPLHDYTTDQGSAYLRGRQSYAPEPDDKSIEDLVEMFEKARNRKNGGAISTGTKRNQKKRY
tara:strand:- start:926 stop:1693 length:768 start_codon:yes stop_codon:yes gene_type:complete